MSKLLPILLFFVFVFYLTDIANKASDAHHKSTSLLCKNLLKGWQDGLVEGAPSSCLHLVFLPIGQVRFSYMWLGWVPVGWVHKLPMT